MALFRDEREASPWRPLTEGGVGGERKRRGRGEAKVGHHHRHRLRARISTSTKEHTHTHSQTYKKHKEVHADERAALSVQRTSQVR